MDRGVNARDAGLEKIRQIDNWMIAGAIGLTLAFSAAAAQAFKGHSRHASSSAAPASLVLVRRPERERSSELGQRRPERVVVRARARPVPAGAGRPESGGHGIVVSPTPAAPIAGSRRQRTTGGEP